MSKRCAKCEKTVYPLEELKCLDKIWHKSCFKCQVCNMTLNMKNYKGYDKLPYCHAHYPTTKHTQVAETPEMRRIAANTKIQSNLQYHAEAAQERDHYTQIADDPEVRRHMKNTKNISSIQYHAEAEKMKGQVIQIADDPLIMRHKRNMEIASNISYHKDFEDAKGKKISVADDPETERAKKNTNTISNVSYHGVRERNLEMEKRRPSDQVVDAGPTPVFLQQQDGIPGYVPQQQAVQPAQPRHIGSISDYDPLNEKFGSITQQPYSSGGPKGGRMMFRGGAPAASKVQQQPQSAPAAAPAAAPAQAAPMHSAHTAGKKVSKVDFNISQPQTRNMQNDRNRLGQKSFPHNYKPFNEQPPLPSPQQRRHVASESYWSGYKPSYQPQQQQQPYGQQAYGQPAYHQQPQQQQQPRQPAKPRFRAMYDYDAADVDEVSFREGDVIFNTERIDEGWMLGTVEGSQQRGMLPANYVEQIK